MALANMPVDTPLDDWTAFSMATGLRPSVLKKIRPFITEKDASAKPIEGEADSDFRESEIVPFRYEGGIDRFIEQEVWSYAPGAWANPKKTTVGYEIIFSKYFYKPAPMKDIRTIINELNELEKESDGMMAEILGGLSDEY